MRYRTLPLLVVASLMLGLGGCARKATRTTPEPPVAPTPPPPSAPRPPAAVTPPPAAIDPLAGNPEAVDLYIRQQGLLPDVYFDYDRSELREDTRRQLERNERFLQEHPRLVVELEGHCDERGTVEYNLALGQGRAGAARAYLDTLGTADDRLRTVSYGRERPVCQEPGEACHQRNRRVHFRVVGTGAGDLAARN